MGFNELLRMMVVQIGIAQMKERVIRRMASGELTAFE